MRFYFRSVFGVCLIVLAPALAHAQATTGTISGVITDQSKAVLPGVTITVTHNETGIARSLVSDERGLYRALNLAPGAYAVTAELQGFTKIVRNGLNVAIDKDRLC